MVPHSPHALDRILTLSARVFQTSYIDDGSWPSYDRVRSLSSWLEHRPRLPHSSVNNNLRSISSVQITCQMWMENHVQLSAASATVQVLWIPAVIAYITRTHAHIHTHTRTNSNIVLG